MSKRTLVLVAILLSCLGCSDSAEPQPSAGSGGEAGDEGGAGASGGSAGSAGAAGSSGDGGSSGAAGTNGVGVGGDGGAGGTGGAGHGGEGGSGPGMCEGAFVGDTHQRVRYASEEVPAGQPCLSEDQARHCTDDGWTDWTGTFTAMTCTELADVCDGMQEMRTRYATEDVAYGEDCVSETQSRSCAADAWGEWSGTYEQETCTVAGPDDCEGAEHGEDASRVRYATATVAYGEDCVSETQTASCDNGVLGAWSGTLTFEACAPEPGLPCGDVASGQAQSRQRFATATVAFGQTCAAQTQMRTCENGAFGDWTGTYTIEACTVDAPADCMDGVHGAMHTRTRYQAATVGWGTSCVSEQQNETCWNGAWLPWTGTYLHESCTVSDPIDCAGGAHGSSQTRTRYQAASVPNGSTCQAESQSSVCTNGTWGAWSGSYTFENCVVAPPFAGSCNLLYMGTTYACMDWVGSFYMPATAMGACGGNYSPNHCAESGNLLGICMVPTNGGVPNSQIEIYHYQGAVYPTEAVAEPQCTTQFPGATWVSR